MVGGVLGSILACGALAAALLWLPSSAAAEPEDVFTVEFVPASLVAAGELDVEVAEDEVAQDEVAEDEAAQDEVVEDEPGETFSEDAEQASAPKPKPKPKPKPTPTTDPKPRPKPTPAPGSPEVDNPFDGDWSDMLADGDPWAAAVMRALRSMRVPAWAGKISSDKPYRFRIRVCRDGSVDKVLRKATTGDADLDATLAHEISRLDLPAVPPAMAKAMGSRCAVLDYEFAWAASGVR